MNFKLNNLFIIFLIFIIFVILLIILEKFMSISRIDELRMVDPVLTTIAQGYKNAAMIAEKIFPTVLVSKLKGKIPLFGREAFIMRDSFRAMRSQSNRIPPSDIELINFETKERDIEIAIDYLEEEESADFYKYEQTVTKQLIDIMLLTKEKEAADLIQDPDNYDEDLLSEIDDNHAFNDYTNSIDPLTYIREAKLAIRNRIGIYPNTLIIGDAAYNALVDHPKIIDRIKYAGLTQITLPILSQLTEMPNFFIGGSVYSENGEDFMDIWRDNIILAYVDQNEINNRSEFNPSFGYTLQREGKPEIDTYYENGGKIKVVRNTDNFCIKVTSRDAAYLISHTNHVIES
jgi:hypothetical protein